MPDYLQDAQTWLSEKFKSHLSTTVTLVRGAGSCTLSAAFQPKSYQVFNQYGIPETYLSWDFIVTTADYKPGGTAVEPARGDRFEFGGRKYEVLPLPGDNSFMFTDHNRTMMIVHTKYTGATT